MNNFFQSANKALSLVRRHLLVLLIAAYSCSTFIPQAGLWLQAPFSTASNVSFIHLLLATLLFTLGLSVSWERTGELISECKWLGLTVGVRIVACLILASISQIVPSGYGSMIVGFILIMAMPTAASSSGWSMQLGCNEPVTVALIIGTTVVSVISAPIALLASSVFASSVFSTQGTSEMLDLLRDTFDARFALYLVVLPTLLGISTRSVAPKLATGLRSVGIAISPVLLLMLNYSNASLSLPQLRSSLSILHTSVLLVSCTALFAALAVFAQLFAGWLNADRATRLSAILGAGMSNTGLALFVATKAMPKQVELHLAIIVYTFVQHFAVATLASRLAKSESNVSSKEDIKTPKLVTRPRGTAKL